MRVLHFAETLYGGTGTYLNEMLSLQARAYEHVAVLCPEDHAHLLTTPNVEIVPIKGANRSLAGLMRLAGGWRRHLASAVYDVVHLHSSFAGAIGRLLARPAARIVYCPHGWAFTPGTRLRAAPLYSAIERHLAQHTDAIIAISDAEAELAARHGLPTERCALVPSGLRDHAWTPLPSNRATRHLLFVGRYDHQKGIDLLVDAMRGLAGEGFTLDMIGANVIGPAILPRVLPPGVRDLGWQDPDTVRNLMAAADAVIVPSRYEGFGLVVLEAMRAGRPVIASAVGGLTELVIDGKTGLLCKPDPRSLQNAIRRLHGMDAARLGNAARLRFEQHYRAERMVADLDRLYRREARQ